MKNLWLNTVTLLVSSVASTGHGGDHPQNTAPAPFQKSLLSLHKSLVEHPSVTGNEHNVAQFLRSYLKELGWTVETQRVEDDRQNVLAYLGDARETKILVTSHIDTVPPFVPYERKGDRIFGRGVSDAKGSVATQITAVDLLRQNKSIEAGDVALLYVVGEERGGAGMKAANALGLSWDTVIFGEPTELKLVRGHKGGLGVNITANGKAGHSGYPESGRSAIDILVQGLAKLQSIGLPGSEEFGETTLNVGTIGGGVAANVIAQDAFATAAIRIAVDDPSKVKEVVAHALQEVSPWLEANFSSYAIGPVRIDHDIAGFETIVVNYGTDIPSLKGNHKRYLYGPGSILVSHAANENIKISDLVEAVSGYQTLVLETLARSKGRSLGLVEQH